MLLLRSPSPPDLDTAARSAGYDTARVAVVAALITGIVGVFVTIGADARWLAALGRIIAHRGAIPAGVPFATADTSRWANPLVLAELAFHGLESAFGDRGLIVANLVAIAAALALLAADARRDGARPLGIPGALALVAVGSLASLAVARVQMFSLVLFPAMLLLLRSETRRPSARIWLALPLLALWSNLHGAALAGLALLYAYLALERFRGERLVAVLVALAAPLAMCLTPAGIRTVDYYRGLVTNVAAERGAGQWAPFGHSPFDWVLLVAVAALLALALRPPRRRLPWWEVLALAGFAALTVKAGRDGVWLMFLLVAPAAKGSRAARGWNGLLPVGAAAAVALLAFAVARQPTGAGVSRAVLAEALARAHGTPVLADGIAAEQVALAGGRIWAGNPLDAFSRSVQGEYLDWLDGDRSGARAFAIAGVRVVLVANGDGAARLTRSDPAYRYVAGDGSSSLYERRSAGG